MICDNDNVNIDGAEASIYGTRKFMAPEVVRREVLPSTKTDLFSMAVLFFYILFGWHPLDGRREAGIKILDARAENALYGTEPIFIFDPVNDANGPVEAMHDALVYRWNSLSEELRALFVRSFTHGLFSPDQRVLEREWLNVFARVPAAVFACAQCAYEHVADVDAMAQRAVSCAYCGGELGAPPLIVIGRNAFVVQPGQTIPLQVLRPEAGLPPAAHGGIVEAHPQRPELVGLRNLTDAAWSAALPGQRPTRVEPQRTVRIVDGMQIDFGASRAVVVEHYGAAPADGGPGARGEA